MIDTIESVELFGDKAIVCSISDGSVISIDQISDLTESTKEKLELFKSEAIGAEMVAVQFAGSSENTWLKIEYKTVDGRNRHFGFNYPEGDPNARN